MEAKPKVNGGVKDGKQNRRMPAIHGPTNPMVTPLLTDLYQFTMAYAYWKAGKHKDRAVLVSQFLFFIFIILLNFSVFCIIRCMWCKMLCLQIPFCLLR